MHPYNVIVRPILSEKSNEVRESEKKYVFEVAKAATKKDIHLAVSKLWDVKVEKVQTLIRRGKIRRRGNKVSKPVSSKRAYVTLAEGQKLPLFEDQ